MATDGPDPQPCDPEIFQHGTVIFITHTIPSNAMEGWVRKVAEASGQPVDWHFVGGRACVRALGDLQAVRAAIDALLPEHDALYAKAVKRIRLAGDRDDDIVPPRWFPQDDSAT